MREKTEAITYNNEGAFCPEEYDEKIQRTLPYYEEFYKQVIDILKITGKNSLSWLDIGCGTGKMYEMVRGKLSLQEFIFTDISDKMLDIARSRFEMEGNCFYKISVQELSDENRYDVITAIQVNHYLSKKDREESIRRCLKALKAGGFFFTFENIAPGSESCKKLFLQRWQDYQIQNGKSMEEASRHIMRYGKEYFPISVEEHLNSMKRCGFQAVELIWMSYMQAGFMGMKD